MFGLGENRQIYPNLIVSYEGVHHNLKVAYGQSVSQIYAGPLNIGPSSNEPTGVLSKLWLEFKLRLFPIVPAFLFFKRQPISQSPNPKPRFSKGPFLKPFLHYGRTTLVFYMFYILCGIFSSIAKFSMYFYSHSKRMLIHSHSMLMPLFILIVYGSECFVIFFSWDQDNIVGILFSQLWIDISYVKYSLYGIVNSRKLLKCILFK